MEITGWSQNEQLNSLREGLREYVALQTQFSKTIQTIEQRYKSEKTRKDKIDTALRLLIDRHNSVGRELNRLLEEW